MLLTEQQLIDLLIIQKTSMVRQKYILSMMMGMAISMCIILLVILFTVKKTIVLYLQNI